MAIELTDDGTMDTVLRCDLCGEEMRYNYDPSGPDADDSELTDEEAYDAFIEWAIEDATDDHECSEAEDAEPTEPDEEDITTDDHQTFYQNGKLVLFPAKNSAVWYFKVPRGPLAGEMLGAFGDDHKAALRAYMERTQYWPNVWFISDHGNAHLMDLSEDK